MEEQAAGWVLKLLRDGGALGGLVLSLLGNVWLLRRLLQAHIDHAAELKEEHKDHLATSDRVATLTTEFIRLNSELKAKIVRRNPPQASP